MHFLDTVELHSTISFKSDTLTYTVFNESLHYGYDQVKWPYDQKEDSLFIYVNEKQQPFNYTAKDNILDVDMYESSDVVYETRYRRLDEYNMSKFENEIHLFLTNAPVKVNNEKDKLELNSARRFHMPKFYKDSLEADYGFDGNDWYFHTLDSELFLIIGTKVVHIRDFDNRTLYGCVYSKEESEFNITQTAYTKNYNLNHLAGEWQTDNGEIKLTEKKVIIRNSHGTETTNWEFNKYNNKLVLEDYYDEFWKILSISSDEFVVKRSRKSKTDRSQFEILYFSKVR